MEQRWISEEAVFVQRLMVLDVLYSRGIQLMEEGEILDTPVEEFAREIEELLGA